MIINDLSPIDSIQDWLPTELFCEKFKNIPQKTIKWQLSNRSRNGLTPYVKTIGKKLYISQTGYAKWLNQQPVEANHAS